MPSLLLTDEALHWDLKFLSKYPANSIKVYSSELTEIAKLTIRRVNDFDLLSGNYSVAGFELTLRRKVSHYIITYYLPSGMFVIVSWISFLVPPEIVPGRMTLLVTVFLVLVNIFNTITTNIPKAEGLTGKQKMKIIPELGLIFWYLDKRSLTRIHYAMKFFNHQPSYWLLA